MDKERRAALIQSALKMKRLRQKDIARLAGVSESLVSRVISGTGVSARVCRALKHAGVPEWIVEGKEKAA